MAIPLRAGSVLQQISLMCPIQLPGGEEAQVSLSLSVYRQEQTYLPVNHHTAEASIASLLSSLSTWLRSRYQVLCQLDRQFWSEASLHAVQERINARESMTMREHEVRTVSEQARAASAAASAAVLGLGAGAAAGAMVGTAVVDGVSAGSAVADTMSSASARAPVSVGATAGAAAAATAIGAMAGATVGAAAGAAAGAIAAGAPHVAAHAARVAAAAAAGVASVHQSRYSPDSSSSVYAAFHARSRLSPYSRRRSRPSQRPRIRESVTRSLLGVTMRSHLLFELRQRHSPGGYGHGGSGFVFAGAEEVRRVFHPHGHIVLPDSFEVSALTGIIQQTLQNLTL